MISVRTPTKGIGMAGTSSKSQKFEMRVPIATLEAWKARAAIGGTSVASLIVQSMEASRIDAQSLAVALTKSEAEVAALQTDVANLKRELAKRPIATRAVIQPMDLEAAKRNAIRRPLTDPPVVASVLPVTGTEFPGRPVYLRGQAPAKSKGKLR